MSKSSDQPNSLAIGTSSNSESEVESELASNAKADISSTQSVDARSDDKTKHSPKAVKTNLKTELIKLAIYCTCFYVVLGCAIKFSPLYNAVVLRPEKRNAFYDQVINNKEEFRFPNKNGDTLNAWYFRVPGAKKVALVFHGNAGNVTHRLLIAKAFLKEGVSVFLFDYRGYGTSTGTPTVEGLIDDGESAYKFVNEHLGYPPKSIILYGESIGTAVTSRIALDKEYNGIILQSGLTSLPDVAGDGIMMLKLYPKWVFPDPHFDTKNIISRLKGPMLILHGEKDKLIPAHHAHELYTKAPEPKSLVLIPSAGHNDMLSADEKIISDALKRFLAGLP